jgi:hypothetical protein
MDFSDQIRFEPLSRINRKDFIRLAYVMRVLADNKINN